MSHAPRFAGSEAEAPRRLRVDKGYLVDGNTFSTWAQPWLHGKGALKH